MRGRSETPQPINERKRVDRGFTTPFSEVLNARSPRWKATAGFSAQLSAQCVKPFWKPALEP